MGKKAQKNIQEEIRDKVFTGANVPSIEPTGMSIGAGNIITGEKFSQGINQQENTSSHQQITGSKQNNISESTKEINKAAIDAIGNIDTSKIISPFKKVNAEDDGYLKSIGQMRKDREETLKKNIQSSADRERKKMKFNAWVNFLTSLGNIAGLGSAAPVKIDNTRTLESFKRMQDIYDAADNIESDPTLTWLDKERLNREAALALYNLQGAEADRQLGNQFKVGLARDTGVKSTTRSTSEGASATQGSTKGYAVNQQENITQEAMPEDVINAKSGKGSGEYAVMIGGGKGIPAANLKGLTKAEALFMVTDVLDARKNGGRSSATGKDVGDLIGNTITYTYKGKPKEYNVNDADDMDILMAVILGNSGESQVAINTLASKFDKRDKDGVYYNYFNGIQVPEDDYEGNLDGEV